LAVALWGAVAAGAGLMGGLYFGVAGPAAWFPTLGMAFLPALCAQYLRMAALVLSALSALADALLALYARYALAASFLSAWFAHDAALYALAGRGLCLWLGRYCVQSGV